MTSHTEFNENTPKSIWVALGLWFVTGSFGLWYTEKCNFLKAFIIWIAIVVLVFIPVLSYEYDNLEILALAPIVYLILYLALLFWTVRAVQQFNANLAASSEKKQ